MPSEANSHLPESELRGARPLPRGKIEKLINLNKAVMRGFLPGQPPPVLLLVPGKSNTIKII